MDKEDKFIVFAMIITITFIAIFVKNVEYEWGKLVNIIATLIKTSG